MLGMGVVVMIRHGCGSHEYGSHEYDSHEYGSHGCDRIRLPRMVIIPVPGQGVSGYRGLISSSSYRGLEPKKLILDSVIIHPGGGRPGPRLIRLGRGRL